MNRRRPQGLNAMRRRSQVGLVLAGTLPLMLAGCGGSAPDTYTLSKTMNFPSVAECAQAGFSTNICASAFISARNDYERTTPEYDSKKACEDDFVPDYCEAKTVAATAPASEEQTLWRPRMNGFALNVEGELSEAQVKQAKQEAAASGHANDSQLLEGILLGYLLKSGMQGTLLYGPAQPTYLVRDPAVQPQPNTSTGSSYSGSSYSASRYSGGGMRSSTLGEQVERGQHYSQSRQSQRYGSDYYHRPSTLGQSLRSSSSSSGLSRHAASSSTSRGGFGSQSSARGGWSGHSSSHGS